GEADHEGRLESALEQVHTLIHLIGGPLPGGDVTVEWLNLITTEVALKAAANAGVRRVLFLSPLGADAASEDPYLAAKGRAEEAISRAAMEHAIFRCAPIVGPGSAFTSALERGLSSAALMNPVAVDDVGLALVAADMRDAELRGTWELGGPETMTPGELAARLGTRAGALTRVLRGAPKELAALYQRDQIADPSEAVRQFGFSLAPV
ncbi:MAG: hypothetical protein ACRDKS_11490, partial [Actinomycetota bacterium]